MTAANPSLNSCVAASVMGSRGCRTSPPSVLSTSTVIPVLIPRKPCMLLAQLYGLSAQPYHFVDDRVCRSNKVLQLLCLLQKRKVTCFQSRRRGLKYFDAYLWIQIGTERINMAPGMRSTLPLRLTVRPYIRADVRAARGACSLSSPEEPRKGENDARDTVANSRAEPDGGLLQCCRTSVSHHCPC